MCLINDITKIVVLSVSWKEQVVRCSQTNDKAHFRFSFGFFHNAIIFETKSCIRKRMVRERTRVRAPLEISRFFWISAFSNILATFTAHCHPSVSCPWMHGTLGIDSITWLNRRNPDSVTREQRFQNDRIAMSVFAYGFTQAFM